MNSYNLRAFSTKGEPRVFTIRDIPTRITRDLFILSLVPNSPILRMDTITRGTDILDLFEGDALLVNGKEYRISYLRGFVAISEDKEMIQIRDLKDYQIIKQSQKPSKSMLFKFRGQVLNISNIIGAYGGYAVINNIKDRVDPGEIQQDAGFTINKKRIFYGDLFEGYPVIMKDGRPSIKVGDKVYDISINKNQKGD